MLVRPLSANGIHPASVTLYTHEDGVRADMVRRIRRNGPHAASHEA